MLGTTRPFGESIATLMLWLVLVWVLLLVCVAHQSKWVAHVAVCGELLKDPTSSAERAPAFSSARELDRWLAPEVFKRLPLPYSAGWLAAAAFLKYRRSGGVKTSPLPDFYIGAHAEAEGLVLVTRDPVRYRTYFPKVRLVAPA